VLQFEDKFIKEKYLIGKSGARRGVKSKRHWWSLFSVLGVLMLSALVYGMINRMWPFHAARQKPGDSVLIASSGIAPSAGLVQSTPPAPAITAPPIGGYLIFLHVSGRRHLDSLRQLSGARVLDQFNPSEASQSKLRKLSRPIPPGNYSFMIVDSLQSTVYRRDGIRLRALPATADTTRSKAATANAPAPSTRPSEPPATAPPILSRAINDTTRRLAKDTLNLRDNFNQ
jgi:hypothetical protein